VRKERQPNAKVESQKNKQEIYDDKGFPDQVDDLGSMLLTPLPALAQGGGGGGSGGGSAGGGSASGASAGGAAGGPTAGTGSAVGSIDRRRDGRCQRRAFRSSERRRAEQLRQRSKWRWKFCKCA
jgi:hypothetical protein